MTTIDQSDSKRLMASETSWKRRLSRRCWPAAAAIQHVNSLLQTRRLQRNLAQRWQKRAHARHAGAVAAAGDAGAAGDGAGDGTAVVDDNAAADAAAADCSAAADAAAADCNVADFAATADCNAADASQKLQIEARKLQA